jgi:GntR family phosphonate transport system transcriptional regulator
MREVDRASRTPPWQQIAAVLRAEIAGGRYGPDTPLPSLTTLSQRHGVNRKTARKAMTALAAEGLVEVEEGMGYYLKRLPAAG